VQHVHTCFPLHSRVHLCLSVYCCRYVVNVWKSQRIWWGLESGHPIFELHVLVQQLGSLFFLCVCHYVKGSREDVGRKKGKIEGFQPMQIINSGNARDTLLKCHLQCKENMLPFSVFHDIGPTILAERWTLVSYQHRPNVALQPISNVHYDIGPTYSQCQCFGWVTRWYCD